MHQMTRIRNIISSITINYDFHFYVLSAKNEEVFKSTVIGDYKGYYMPTFVARVNGWIKFSANG